MIKQQIKLLAVTSSAILTLSSTDVIGANVALFNTGVDSSSANLPLGASDPHWSITSGPNITVATSGQVVANQLTGTYAVDVNSQWIWVNANGGPTGTYVFTQTFDLTGFDPSTATISGSWAADNEGFIQLNGSSTNIGSGVLSLSGNLISNFENFSNFSLNSGFIPGINTLEFVITNPGGPGGFNATNLRGSVDPIPEPSSLLLLSLAVLGISNRRTRS